MSRPRKQSFIESVDPYRKDIFVCTGFKDTSEIIKAGKKMKLNKDFIDFIERNREKTDSTIKDNAAFLAVTPKSAGIMCLRPYHDTWEFWETLIHELNHYMKFLSENIGMENEIEAQAYLQEHLFHKIRRKLQGTDPQKV